MTPSAKSPGSRRARGTTRHPLIPSQGIALLANGCDGHAFARLFRDSWRRIPLAARRQICSYWRKCGEVWPRIELSDQWADCEYRHAHVTQSGRDLYFCASSFQILPARAAEWLIAHEVAHVYQKACGRKPGGENEAENEANADTIAKQWGFSPVYYFFVKKLEDNFLKTMERNPAFERACAEVAAFGQ